MKVTGQIYCQFLIHSPKNYTGTYLAEHFSPMDHNSVYRFLKYSEQTPSMLWEKVGGSVNFVDDGYLVFDDSVLDKDHSHAIEGVRRQYSGNAHGIIKGIGFVSCVYYNARTDEFDVIDYRIFDPDRDGKTKLDHVSEMFALAISRGVKFRTVLMDSWYGTKYLLMQIEEAGKIYYVPLKKNRLVDDSGGRDRYRSIESLSWNEGELKSGKTIKIKGFPKDHKVKLFRVAVATNRTDWLVTNDQTQHTTTDAQKVSAYRWKIEQFHREIKQTTGIERCQCRLNRSQRNHIALAVIAWTAMKNFARKAQITIYQVKQQLYKDVVIHLLRNPVVEIQF